MGEGKAAGRVFQAYALPDCQQLSGENGGDDPPESHPWFEVSCQTASTGQCHAVPYSVQSFAIQEASGYNEGVGGCANWAVMGAASSQQRGLVGIGSLAILLGVWIIM